MQEIGHGQRTLNFFRTGLNLLPERRDPVL